MEENLSALVYLLLQADNSDSTTYVKILTGGFEI